MRVYVHIPDTLLGRLHDQARAAHRPPRYYLEWLIREALQEPPAEAQRLAAQQPQPEEVLCAVE